MASPDTDVSVVGNHICAQRSDTLSVPSGPGALARLSAGDRDDLLRSLISSQAIEGVEISYEEAERILDEVLREPLPHIG